MVQRESVGTASAFWATAPGVGELRAEQVEPVTADDVLVRTLFTGVSRGTERLVLRGEVPETEAPRMRAPFQAGEFPFPVKYGYLNVGVVKRGSTELLGKTVFTLFPHQSRFVVPESAVTVVPEAVPAERAVLAGAVETAVNVLWDARPAIGDRVAVIGAGMIGSSIARLARRFTDDVVLVDVDPTRRETAARLGVGFAAPDDAPPDRDIVIDASGSGAGVALGLRLAATDGEVVVASWLGTVPVSLELGADFHSRRITIRSSQVGGIGAAKRGRRTSRQRLELALRLLDDPAFDALLGEVSASSELPNVMAAVSEGSDSGLCHVIDWSDSGCSR